MCNSHGLRDVKRQLFLDTFNLVCSAQTDAATHCSPHLLMTEIGHDQWLDVCLGMKEMMNKSLKQ